MSIDSFQLILIAQFLFAKSNLFGISLTEMYFDLYNDVRKYNINQ